MSVSGDVEADAIEVCAALAAWAAPRNPDATVGVTAAGGNTVYASGTAADGR